MVLSNDWHMCPAHLSGCGLVKRIHGSVTHVQGLSQEQHVNAYNSRCHYSLHITISVTHVQLACLKNNMSMPTTVAVTIVYTSQSV